jgi:hypothetical protein
MKLDTIPLPLHTGSEHGPEREGFAYHDGFADFTPDLAGRLLREQRALHSAVARRATWLLQGSRGDTGRHGGAALAPHGAAVWEIQDAMGEQKREYGRLLWGAAVETQDTIEERKQEHGRPYGAQQWRHRTPLRSRSRSMGAHMGGSRGDTGRHAGAGAAAWAPIWAAAVETQGAMQEQEQEDTSWWE